MLQIVSTYVRVFAKLDSNSVESVLHAHLGPIFVAHLYSFVTPFRKLSHSFLTPAQIEFPIDNLKCLGVYAGNLPGQRQASCSVASVFRGIAFGGCREQVSVFCTCKMPLGIIPFMGKLAFALHRPAFSMVGNSVVPLDSDAEPTGVDRLTGVSDEPH